jgi:hypothetical protein
MKSWNNACCATVLSPASPCASPWTWGQPEAIAPHKGYAGYQTPLKAYIRATRGVSPMSPEKSVRDNFRAKPQGFLGLG